jgi:hypothetical protein
MAQLHDDGPGVSTDTGPQPATFPAVDAADAAPPAVEPAPFIDPVATAAAMEPAPLEAAPPPELAPTERIAWAFQHAAQAESEHPDFQRDRAADAARFRAAFEAQAGVDPSLMKWMSDELYCFIGPVGEPSEVLCFVRAHALEGESPLFNHLFDRMSMVGNPQVLVEPARIPGATFEEVEGDVYALFPDQFAKGKVE